MLPHPSIEMHVALATPAFPLPRSGRNAGIERLAKELAEGLMTRGIDVTLITTFWNGGQAFDHFGKARIIRIADTSSLFGRSAAVADSHYWSWGFRVAPVLKKVVRPDIVHALTPLASTSSLTKAKIPVVTTFHHADEIWRLRDLLHRPFHRILESRGYLASTLLIIPSQASATAAAEMFGIPHTKIRIVYWGVDAGRFKPREPLRSRETRLFYVGHHETRKGLAYLLEALAILDREGVPVRLTTVGSGDQLLGLKRMADHLGISDLVTFLGYVPDPDNQRLPELYSNADVFVFPSLMEGFGFVLVEAMATGLPVVASDVSSIPEVVGDAGILFPAKNPVALARILRDLAEDPQKRSELARRGRERVETLFTWDRVIPKLVSVYEEAMKLQGRVS